MTYLVACETELLWLTESSFADMYAVFDALFFCFAGDFQS